MQGFVDETLIEVSSGNGGPGCVSFRREKYVPRGGPDGGDGGKGGDVIFFVKSNLKTLSYLKMKRVFKAKNGLPGEGRKKFGSDGNNVEIYVPPGTLIKDSDTGEILRDLQKEGEKWVFLKGGRGGQGNHHFATSRKQTPRYAQPGLPGKAQKLIIELQIIADIGFVGFPNAGKSTLLSVLTNANPEIASYAFTTKIPNLGVLRIDDFDIILADIPGIIDGASKGIGLGLKFLKHIARTSGIAFLIDLTDEDYINSYEILKKELIEFSVKLFKKRHILIGTKMDIHGTEEKLDKLKTKYPDEIVIGISSVAKIGMKKLQRKFVELVKENKCKQQ